MYCPFCGKELLELSNKAKICPDGLCRGVIAANKIGQLSLEGYAKYIDEILDIEKHEKLLRPKFNEEIFKIYLAYVERQATITDKDAYKRVADTLIRMKTFPGGREIVKQLVSKYRHQYKRRPYMMKELNRV